MKFYFAPMEGITGYVYRNAHHRFFNQVDQYFSPFIVANQSKNYKTRGFKDILPENNPGMVVIPQLLTKDADDFIHTSKKIKDLGYSTINLNLGCPSGTVVSKNRGAGFLAQKDELDAFLDTVFSEAVTKISIKTRIGKNQPEEFYDLIEIFNKYPMEELIIHPRIQKDMYKNKPNLKIFNDAMGLSKNPICYNGDIFSIADYKKFIEDYPEVDAIMLGRGLLANPGMIGEITNKTKLDKKILRDFHDEIYENYKKNLFGERNVLFKMKELWFYISPIFSEYGKYAKKIKKAKGLKDYDDVVSSLFNEQKILI